MQSFFDGISDTDTSKSVTGIWTACENIILCTKPDVVSPHGMRAMAAGKRDLPNGKDIECASNGEQDGRDSGEHL